MREVRYCEYMACIPRPISSVTKSDRAVRCCFIPFDIIGMRYLFSFRPVQLEMSFSFNRRTGSLRQMHFLVR